MKQHRGLLFALLLLFTLTSCSGPDGKKDETNGKNGTPEELKLLCEELHRSIHVTKDYARARTIFRGFLPDEQRIRKALKDEASPEDIQAVVSFHERLQGVTHSDEDLRKGLPLANTDVRVYRATTEQLISNEAGTLAHERFPPGANKLATKLLRPGLVFHEVDFCEPSKAEGMRYSLFYWDKQQWSMLGPVWRSLAFTKANPSGLKPAKSGSSDQAMEKPKKRFKWYITIRDDDGMLDNGDVTLELPDGEKLRHHFDINENSHTYEMWADGPLEVDYVVTLHRCPKKFGSGKMDSSKPRSGGGTDITHHVNKAERARAYLDWAANGYSGWLLAEGRGVLSVNERQRYFEVFRDFPSNQGLGKVRIKPVRD